MSTHTLKPWTDQVKLHPDVESDALTEAMFAIDLGAVAANDPDAPTVYRDANAFFKATYPTSDLRQLLEENLASLAGKSGYNRVLKLRTHFGGGKSHVLVALWHAAQRRSCQSPSPFPLCSAGCEKFSTQSSHPVAPAARPGWATGNSERHERSRSSYCSSQSLSAS